MKTIKKLKKKFNESAFKEIYVAIWRNIREIYKDRRKQKYLKSILPDYYSCSNCSVFLHTYKIPENSDAILELKKLKVLLESNRFVKNDDFKSDEDTFKVTYSHKKHGIIYFYIFIDDSCDIVFKRKMIKKPQLTGLCAKVLEELNN